jgi:hypothetical protein
MYTEIVARTIAKSTDMLVSLILAPCECKVSLTVR